MPGVPVLVTRADGASLYAGRTDSAGRWSYLLPDATTVSVRFLAPTASTFTVANVGDDAADSDADATGRTVPRTITADDLRIDAGLRVNADLSVAKAVPPPSGVVPVVATYSLNLANSGPGPAAGVVVTDLLPAGAGLVAGSVTVSQGTVTTTSSAITWTVGAVPAGTGPTLTSLEPPCPRDLRQPRPDHCGDDARVPNRPPPRAPRTRPRTTARPPWCR